MTIVATRLSDQPIIAPHMDDRMGDNIGTPSIIRMPDWAEGRLGRYHLYFSDHKRAYIRLAYADHVLGPWSMHRPGALDIAASHFPTVAPTTPDGPSASSFAGLSDDLYAHIASPDVHIDHERRLFRMYFHGMLETGDQATRLAISRDGVRFTAEPQLLGAPYFRVFEHDGALYTITWGGELWRSRAWDAPFERGPHLIALEIRDGVERRFRHGDAHRRGDRLHVFYSRIGDRPERILHSEVDLRGDWSAWRATEPVAVLAPERVWEGGDRPLETSEVGAAEGLQRQLRDPCVFVDADGAAYLLYCGGGESGIGVCALSGL